MEKLKIFLNNLSKGFSFGFGFCIAAWAAYFMAQATLYPRHPMPSDMPEFSSPAAGFQPNRSSVEKLQIANVEEIKVSADRTFFTGTIKNNGTKPANGISIEVNLFKSGKFVDQYSTYVSSAIAPGESRYFKISCGCKDAPPADHDSYKVQVFGGF